MKLKDKKRKAEKGQAILLVVVAMAIVLVGGLGLAIDGSQLYAHSQMAQAAADAAALAGAMSMFQGVNTSGAAQFNTSATFTCSTTDLRLPCQYASLNGFGSTAADTVAVSFPDCPMPANPCGYGAKLSASDSPNQIKVTITRNVSTSFIRMLGAGSTAPIIATAVAGITADIAPVPIVVVHPTLSGALSAGGTTTITIIGGPQRSIQVNSSSLTAYSANGGNKVNLSLGGYGGPGTGSDFAVFGGPATDPTGVPNYGSTGHYVQPGSPIEDPLLFVQPPNGSTGTSPCPSPCTYGVTATKPLPIDPPAVASDTANGCDPAIDTKGCNLYSPGTYSATSINVTNKTALFTPGVYFIDNNNGFTSGANGQMKMCVGCPANASPDIANGMLVYNNGTGTFNVGANGNVTLLGTPLSKDDGLGNTVASRFAGMLFFESRSAPAHTGPNSHSLGGGGCISLTGTIYTTNTKATILANPAHPYQELQYAGNPCNLTAVAGEIITDKLQLRGTSELKMNLTAAKVLAVRQVALVGGGPHL